MGYTHRGPVMANSLEDALPGYAVVVQVVNLTEVGRYDERRQRWIIPASAVPVIRAAGTVLDENGRAMKFWDLDETHIDLWYSQPRVNANGVEINGRSFPIAH